MGSLSSISDDSPFTLENIPFGLFSTKDDSTPRTATAIGDFAVDLRALSKAGLFSDESVAGALSQVRKKSRNADRYDGLAGMEPRNIENNDMNRQH